MLGYSIYNISKKILEIINNNLITILLLMGVLSTMIFPGVVDIVGFDFYVFYVIFTIFYIFIRLFLIHAEYYDKYDDNNYNNDYRRYYGYDNPNIKTNIKYDEKWEFNGLTKSQVKKKKENIRKNLKKENLI